MVSDKCQSLKVFATYKSLKPKVQHVRQDAARNDGNAAGRNGQH
jgi:hypothetical protein